MEKLTLEQLAPYLPYELKLWQPNHKAQHILDVSIKEGVCERPMSVITMLSMVSGSKIKPILRPLSDLTKEIEHNGERFVPIYRLGELALSTLPDGFNDLDAATKWVSISVYIGTDEMMYWLFVWLVKHHFDVFGLIAAGLAVDIKQVEGGR